ncbi:hypothetical protein L1987_37034 [Smallanthus sonchifolius]|uniref:Uncharacterized protein n=1 Tax=Smallanthus sonchifolius TaxID=185202 RepID=A0ACB9HGH2_9ASTR|nr:hypothetical protein L1987_37034 [Smallanthus sonchifolius]
MLLREMKKALKSFELDSSQEAAVLSCVASRDCDHKSTVKLIWGPPGTGKTKTISSLLVMLLRMKCRTLTCAPTNIAVLGVAKRVMSLVRDSLVYDTYGLGDIVLFGNGEKMKIDKCKDFSNIFLNLRVKILADCLAPLSGWKGSKFGRSLFERLVLSEHKKHLLNVQYRMHPSISQFPNREFYNKSILDGVNVKSKTYEKRFLDGNTYGSYSFINISSAKEELDKSHSTTNVMEVAVVAEIVASLFKQAVARKQFVSVGCISPYKAQVNAIQEKIDMKYTGYETYFTVNVRSVDGFQGSEEDVIIISTVKFSDTFLKTIARLTDHEICNKVLPLLVKLSGGWREPENTGNSRVNTAGTCTLLEEYKVTHDLLLIWAVDIVSQDSVCIQVLKVWDALPATKVKELLKMLTEKVYGNYTVNMMNRCKERHTEGRIGNRRSNEYGDSRSNRSLMNQPTSTPSSSSSSRTSSYWSVCLIFCLGGSVSGDPTRGSVSGDPTSMVIQDLMEGDTVGKESLLVFLVNQV